MSHELFKKHRPTKLSDVMGQEAAVAALRKSIRLGKIAHSILFNGPTGTGKTTLMRIMRRVLKCSENDYIEINTADFKGIETIRDLRRNLNLQPISGDSRVIAIDECHKLTNDAQNAILKLLEDTPDHVWFLLGTTDPHKLLAALIGRCTEIKLSRIGEDDLEKLIRSVIDKEKLRVYDGIVEEIATAADGSARKALVILEAVAAAGDEAEQRRAIQITTVNKDLAFALAKALMWPKGDGWEPVALLLQRMKDEEPEAVRHCVLGLARAMLVGKGGKVPDKHQCARAAKIIDEFEHHFYDSHGPGLAYTCWSVMFEKK